MVFVVLLLLRTIYWLLQSTLWKKVTMCNIDVYAAMPVVIKIFAQLLYENNLLINNYIFLGPHGC